MQNYILPLLVAALILIARGRIQEGGLLLVLILGVVIIREVLTFFDR